jgi:membrane protease YdiL (CAAX protease family)
VFNGNQDDLVTEGSATHEPSPASEPSAEPALADSAPLQQAPSSGEPDLSTDPTGRTRLPGFTPWLTLVTVLGIATALLGMVEASVLIGLAGMFVSAQGADLDLFWRRIYHLISWVVPVSGMLLFALLTQMLSHSDLPTGLRMAVVVFSGASGVLCMLTGLRPVSNGLIRLLFRGEPPSHTLRLAARLVLISLLLGLPAWFAFRSSLSALLQNPSDFINPGTLSSGLLGYTVLALAAVGLFVRRSPRATLERLGITALRPRDAGIVLAGVAALFLFNSAMETLQRSAFPQLWASDQAFGNALAKTLGPGQIILLGLSAGIGEEITMRGALQPRLGILLTSLLFALLHVQYSWFGILVIMVLGMLLGTLRRFTNTTVAMTVHALYDILAVVSVLPRP